MKHVCMTAVAALALVLGLSGCAITPNEPGWITLIDGEKGLENFTRQGEANWRAEDGAIVADKGGKVNSNLVSKDSYGDFQLRVEFWASHDANSGVYIRITDPKKVSSLVAYEVQIWDQNPAPNFSTGAIVRYVPIVHAPKAGGKWNTYEITAKGPYLTVVLNGERTIHTYDSNFARGPLSLQYGRGTLKFRKVQIKPL